MDGLLDLLGKGLHHKTIEQKWPLAPRRVLSEVYSQLSNFDDRVVEVKRMEFDEFSVDGFRPPTHRVINIIAPSTFDHEKNDPPHFFYPSAKIVACQGVLYVVASSKSDLIASGPVDESILELQPDDLYKEFYRRITKRGPGDSIRFSRDYYPFNESLIIAENRIVFRPSSSAYNSETLKELTLSVNKEIEKYACEKTYCGNQKFAFSYDHQTIEILLDAVALVLERKVELP